MPGERDLPRGFNPPDWAKFATVDATWYTDKEAARAAVHEAKPR